MLFRVLQIKEDEMGKSSAAVAYRLFGTLILATLDKWKTYPRAIFFKSLDCLVQSRLP